MKYKLMNHNIYNQVIFILIVVVKEWLMFAQKEYFQEINYNSYNQ